MMKKRSCVAVLTAGVLLMMPVTQASAEPDRDEFSVDVLVDPTSVIPDPDSRTTPNGKWKFFDGTYVEANGVATIGDNDYDPAMLTATLRGKLNPPLETRGTEWITFTLSLNPGDPGELVCHGTAKVKRYVDDRYPQTPVPYGEAGKFRANCDDGTKVMGDLVGEFGFLNGNPGFLVSMDGTAR
jgi:hypothetical protein